MYIYLQSRVFLQFMMPCMQFHVRESNPSSLSFLSLCEWHHLFKSLSYFLCSPLFYSSFNCSNWILGLLNFIHVFLFLKNFHFIIWNSQDSNKIDPNTTFIHKIIKFLSKGKPHCKTMQASSYRPFYGPRVHGLVSYSVD